MEIAGIVKDFSVNGIMYDIGEGLTFSRGGPINEEKLTMTGRVYKLSRPASAKANIPFVATNGNTVIDIVNNFEGTPNGATISWENATHRFTMEKAFIVGQPEQNLDNGDISNFSVVGDVITAQPI